MAVFSTDLPVVRLPILSPLRSLARMVSVAHQRRALAALDDALLADLGLTRAEAETEANRPVWDMPQTGRC